MGLSKSLVQRLTFPAPHLKGFWAAENQLLRASDWSSNTLVLGISQHAFLTGILTNK